MDIGPQKVHKRKKRLGLFFYVQTPSCRYKIPVQISFYIFIMFSFKQGATEMDPRSVKGAANFLCWDTDLILRLI